MAEEAAKKAKEYMEEEGWIEEGAVGPETLEIILTHKSKKEFCLEENVSSADIY